MTPRDETIVATIFELLEQRAADATICPSEVARALSDDEATWRASMPEVRHVAARLASQGRLRVSARGQEVDALEVRGAIRLGRPRPPAR